VSQASLSYRGEPFLLFIEQLQDAGIYEVSDFSATREALRLLQIASGVRVGERRGPQTFRARHHDIVCVLAGYP
jgi:hypothetical protein